jgi:DNA mismatch endonuclease, patch repair protein
MRNESESVPGPDESVKATDSSGSTADRQRRKSRDEVARNMGAIRSSNNRTEVALGKKLHRMGLRYRKYASKLPGKPDFVFPGSKVVVFVDGDYWHGRVLRERGLEALESTVPYERQNYWLPKLQRNVARDEYVTRALHDLGWHVVRYWESDIRRTLDATAEAIARVVRDRRNQTP